MTSIAVSELRSNLMKVLREIELGSSVNITSRGKVVARLVPADFNKKNAREKLQALSKTTTLHDVLSPVEEVWEADGR
jgi:prevent-host-death family protein